MTTTHQKARMMVAADNDASRAFTVLTAKEAQDAKDAAWNLMIVRVKIASDPGYTGPGAWKLIEEYKAIVAEIERAAGFGE